MAKPFHATVIDASTGTTQYVTGEFTSDEWAALQRFAEFEEELSRTEYVAARMPLDGKVSWDEESRWHQPALPAPSVTREFLLMLRPFLLESEPTSFYKVLNIVSRRYDNDELRANLSLLRDSYRGNGLDPVQWTRV
jgi:hypothetical protein